MDGGRTERHSAASVQPGGRPPAPGELALVQAFINTHYDLEVNHGAELLLQAAAEDAQTVICATHDPEVIRAADEVLALGE